MRQFILVIAVLALVGGSMVFFSAAAASRHDAVHATRFGNLAIDGYDPVAYFAEGRPVRGERRHEHAWNGATWRFSSAANRDRFALDPQAFAPQYGGYCAWAVSNGYLAPTDPHAWRIVDGRLYLNYDQAVQRDWEQDIRGHIARGDARWPKVLSR